MKKNQSQEEFIKGIWRDNPVFVQVLGMCPMLAVTNSAVNAIAMGMATFFVLVGSSFLVSTFRNLIPKQVRISCFIIIIATFVTIADYTLLALVPKVHKELGAFIPLIVANCLILGRAEAFASRQPVTRSVLDALGMGIGRRQRPDPWRKRLRGGVHGLAPLGRRTRAQHLRGGQ